ncbi:hypothetical protein ACP5PY_24385 [Photobacterium leiognathi subsp. mandapamensis]
MVSFTGLLPTSYTDCTHHLFVTDKTGNSFIDVGEIRAASGSAIRRLSTMVKHLLSLQRDSLRNTGYTSTSAPTVTLSAPYSR